MFLVWFLERKIGCKLYDFISYHLDNMTANNQEDTILKRDRRRRNRKRPRTKALRQEIREKIEIALCTNDSPIHGLFKTDSNSVVSVPFSSVIKLLSLDSDKYQKLTYQALISIGNLSKYFSVVGDSKEVLKIVLKGINPDCSATTVYVDNLPLGCEIVSLQKWASLFGTVVYVHPITERKQEGALVCTERSFQSAFIKFLDKQSPVKFIKVSYLNLQLIFHQLLRKKAARERGKRLKLKWKYKMSAIKNDVSEVWEPRALCLSNSSDIAQHESQRRSKKRRKEYGSEQDDIPRKKFKTIKSSKNDIDAAVAKYMPKAEYKREENIQKKAVDNTPVLVPVTAQSLKKTYRHVGTVTPKEFLVTKTNNSRPKRRRRRRYQVKLKAMVSHPTRYFRHLQAYFSHLFLIKHFVSHFISSFLLFRETFRKLRAAYHDLQKQQMVKLKAILKKHQIPVNIPGLSRKERKKKRGRTKVCCA
ncbi:unnamed protein product [Thelazia callipaeda]|uniref:RRM domain-containing protein n=1 Tax=Thelazia callipaeda TaxID=103827 RepID=A0A0N5CKD3_THECL|nr:unnamed protein product [Thelazia callipaeda]